MIKTTRRPARRTDVPDSRSRAISAVKRALIERKMTQAQLADEADCHEKTIQNLMAGKPVRDQTLFDVSAVLQLDFEDLVRDWHGGKPLVAAPPVQPPPPNGGLPPTVPPALPSALAGRVAAPDDLGAYTLAAVDAYIGTYVTIRPDFQLADHFIAYRTDIAWESGTPSLLFRESERIDPRYSHSGQLYIPTTSMFIHLVSLTRGAMRMVMLSQPDRDNTMRGLITTLNRRGALNIPVSTAIVYIKVPSASADAFGRISPDHPRHGLYKDLLNTTLSDGYARLIT